MVKDQIITDKFALYNGDNVEIVRDMPSNSIPYVIFSPPFESLYTYSNSVRDMGNAKDSRQFARHYGFLLSELFRVMVPGRLMSVHCMDLPMSKQKDGVIGLRDFRGQLIRMAERKGFIYHSQVTIWKDPVIAMQRTKALGLLHKQIKKDSAMSRQGIPDYLVTFRKPGINPEPVAHTNESFPVHMWQRYADPVWVTTNELENDGFFKLTMDINPSDTLQKESAREHKDERHICPLQLKVIDRGINLWSNPGDVVFDPFAGIGSTPYTAVKLGRKGLGCELKDSYYRQAVLNCQSAVQCGNDMPLFA